MLADAWIDTWSHYGAVALVVITALALVVLRPGESSGAARSRLGTEDVHSLA